MKKKKSETDHDFHEHQLEIIKAVAQAWLGRHSTSSRPINEFDAHRLNFQSKSSRFKVEVMNKRLSRKWDFKESLWDSYEIVSVYKKLERGLVLDNVFSGLDDESRVHRRRRESKNSLRNLFSRVPSRRINDAEIPQKDNSKQF